MGVAKSISQTYAKNQYLFWYIQRNEMAKIIELLDKHPELINHSLTVNYKTTPLHRAATNGNISLAKLLIQRYKANVDFKTSAQETALMVAAKRDKLQMVTYLLQNGANPDIISSTGLTALDYAILQGNYQCALKINQKVLITKAKGPWEYYHLAYGYKYRFVDYQIVLDGLEKKTKYSEMKDFLTKPKIKFNDPVVDPRQPWKEWVLRNLEFKDPPLIERSNLPEDLQPQNRNFAKLRHFVTKMTISPLVPKPSLHPKIVEEVHSDYKMNEAPSQGMSEMIEVQSAL